MLSWYSRDTCVGGERGFCKHIFYTWTFKKFGNFLRVSHPVAKFAGRTFCFSERKRKEEEKLIFYSTETGFLFCSRSSLKGGQERNEIPFLLHHPSLALRKITLFIFVHHLPATSHFSSLQPWALVCPQTERINFSFFFLLWRKGFTGDVHFESTLFTLLWIWRFFQLWRVTSEEKWLLAGRSLSLIQGRNLRWALSTSPTAYSCRCLSPRSRRAAGGGKRKRRELGWADVNGGERSSWWGNCWIEKEVWIFSFYPAH